MVLTTHKRPMEKNTVFAGTEKYPRHFYTLKDGPSMLFGGGNLSLFNNKVVAVCGNNKITSDAKEIIRFLVTQLKEQGVTIACSGSSEIEEAVLVECISQGAPAIMLLDYGFGLGRASAKYTLMMNILKNQGVVLSEYRVNSNKSSPIYHNKYKTRTEEHNRLLSCMLGTIYVHNCTNEALDEDLMDLFDQTIHNQRPVWTTFVYSHTKLIFDYIDDEDDAVLVEHSIEQVIRFITSIEEDPEQMPPVGYKPDPQCFRDLGKEAPSQLFTDGNVSLLKTRMVTIVGDAAEGHEYDAPTEQAKVAIKMMVETITNNGMTIVVGMQNAIEEEVTKECIRQNIPMVVILNCGMTLSGKTPATLNILAHIKAKHGLILSEYRCNSRYSSPLRPEKYADRTEERNRLLASTFATVLILEKTYGAEFDEYASDILDKGIKREWNVWSVIPELVVEPEEDREGEQEGLDSILKSFLKSESEKNPGVHYEAIKSYDDDIAPDRSAGDCYEDFETVE